jgi:hydroxypyruvate reductase
VTLELSPAFAGDPVRALLGRFAAAALLAVEPESATRKQLGWLGNDSIRIGSVLLPQPRALHFICVGKAARPMARGALAALDAQLASLTLIDASEKEADFDYDGLVHQFRAEHPYPGATSLEAGRHAASLARSLTKGELLLLAVSGGASSMMCLPHEGISVQEIADLTRSCMNAGIPIAELNCIRASVDQLKFGGLAHLAAPSDCGALILSDVSGDDLDLVGSGPTRRRAIDAMGPLLRDRGIWDELSATIRGQLDSPKPAAPRAARAPFDALVAANADARRAAGEAAELAGYEVISLGNSIRGDARAAGRGFVEACDDPGTRALAPGRCCIIAGGESTVRVSGGGRGGRTLEFGLEVARAIDGREHCHVLCLATDGQDGNSGAAGVVVDGRTMARARSAGLDVDTAADDNDLAGFFETLGDLVITGPTGTNVCDLAIWLEDETR